MESAASVNVQVVVMHLSTHCGLSGGLRDGAGPDLDFGHGNQGGTEWRSLEKPLGLHQQACTQTLEANMREPIAIGDVRFASSRVR